MGANLVHQSYRMTSSKCYTCKIARLMANLAIFSTLWSFSQFFQKYATFSLFLIIHHVQYFCLGSCQEVRQKFFFFHFYSFIFMGGGQNHHFAQFGPIADPLCVTPPHPWVILLQQPQLSPTSPKKALQKVIFFNFAIFQSWFFHFWPFGGKKTPLGGAN